MRVIQRAPFDSFTYVTCRTMTDDRGQVTAAGTANKMTTTMVGLPITTKTRQRRAVLALCFVLLARGNCFHIGGGSQCSPAHAHAPVGSSRSTRSSRASSSSPLEPRHALLKEEGAEGAEGGVPGLLRDVVIEKIEELGGGKVQQVRSAAGCFPVVSDGTCDTVFYLRCSMFMFPPHHCRSLWCEVRTFLCYIDPCMYIYASQ